MRPLYVRWPLFISFWLKKELKIFCGAPRRTPQVLRPGPMQAEPCGTLGLRGCRSIPGSAPASKRARKLGNRYFLEDTAAVLAALASCVIDSLSTEAVREREAGSTPS